MKKTVTKVLCLILVLMCVFALTGCGEIQKAEGAVDEMIAALKAGDYEAVSNYIAQEEDSDADDAILSEEEFMLNSMVENLSYNIVSSEQIDDTTVMVTTEITNIDMEPVMGDFFTKALQYSFTAAFSSPAPTEEEMNQKIEEMFIESVSAPDLETVTNTVDIKVIKADDGSWKIEADDILADALFGGLLTAVEDLENTFTFE